MRRLHTCTAKYGTPPLVSSTGGLVDTVKEGVSGTCETRPRRMNRITWRITLHHLTQSCFASYLQRAKQIRTAVSRNNPASHSSLTAQHLP
jgi:glycogen synthase